MVDARRSLSGVLEAVLMPMAAMSPRTAASGRRWGAGKDLAHMKSRRDHSSWHVKRCLAGAFLALLPTTAGALTALRGRQTPPSPAPSPAPFYMVAPAPSLPPVAMQPWPAQPSVPIEPGTIVQVKKNKAEVVQAFNATAGITYSVMMDQMLGHEYVVRAIGQPSGLIGLPSPDGSNDGTWYFPPSALLRWQDTPGAKSPHLNPLDSSSSAKWALGSEGAGGLANTNSLDRQWTLEDDVGSAANLLEPPPADIVQEVDIQRSSPFLTRRKVREVIDVKCMEMLLHNPAFICPEDSYRNFSGYAVAPSPAPMPCNLSIEAAPNMTLDYAGMTMAYESQIAGLKARIEELEAQKKPSGGTIDTPVRDLLNGFRDAGAGRSVIDGQEDTRNLLGRPGREGPAQAPDGGSPAKRMGPPYMDGSEGHTGKSLTWAVDNEDRYAHGAV